MLTVSHTTQALKTATARLLADRSTLAVAKATGLCRRTVQRYKHGHRVPKAEHLPLLAEYLGIDVADFFVEVES